jgi:ubiquitin-protein ligase E3 C
MFAEELAGNPAKKRAEEAKNRRLRAKREKEAKDARKQKEEERREASAAAAAAAGLTNSGGGAKSSVSSVTNKGELDVPKSVINANVDTGSDKAINLSDKPLTAAQIAAEQRKIRAEARQRSSSATLIQSVIRSRLAAAKTRDEQRLIFDKRMSDLIALAGILKKSGQNDVDYIPPPATASMMVVQFLFFAWPFASRKQHPYLNEFSVILEEQDLPRWAKLIKHIILPGIKCADSDLDPLIPWVDTFSGKRRLTKIMGLCVSSMSRRKDHATSANLDRKSLYADVDSVLRRILRLEGGTAMNYGGGARDEIHQISQSLLFHASPAEDLSETERSRCDIIQSLRFMLLYGSDGKSQPIPPDAGQLRENCIVQDDKDRIATLFKLAVDHLTQQTASGKSDSSIFNSRFVAEILTTPLLTWKVKADAYMSILTTSRLRPIYPPLIDYIHSFIMLNAENVSSGCIDLSLDMKDITLTSCPAPAVLCLLANLIQLGKQCVHLNGSDPNKLHFKAAAEYHNFLTNLINAAPLGTFSRRAAAVEWMYIGSSSTPIVLSDVVVEQASALLADSYVRALFKCAIDDDVLRTEKVMHTKTDKDKSYEKDLADIGTESVSSLAAKEAMMDRNRSFWQGTWAKKLTRSVNALLSGPSEKQTKSSLKGPGQLMNTSSIARQLANGKESVNRTVTSAVLSSANESKKEGTSHKTEHEYNIVFLLSLCESAERILRTC